jgi:hypothetical protein
LAEARRIIVTTREKFIAEHCSEDDRNIYNLRGLDNDVALDLFKKKVVLNPLFFLFVFLFYFI